MRVLLTGGAGYIGTHTCVELLESGHEIVVADDYSNSKPEALRRVKQLTGCEFPAYSIDICDAAALNALFITESIDAVIHFAGLKAVGESVANPLRYYRTNIDGAMTLAEMMAKHGVNKLVFSSSATVYGRVDLSPIDEEAELGSTSPYGWTKFMIEQIFRDAAVADSNLSVALMRYFNPVGAHPSGLIGENPNGIPNNLMPRAVSAAYYDTALPVFGTDYPTPDGTAIRDYIHVSDLAHGHVLALSYITHHTGAEAFNLGTGVGLSVWDIVHGVEAASGKAVNALISERRPGDVPCYYANANKARELLGWEAVKTLGDICRDSWNFQVNNPNGYGDYVF